MNVISTWKAALSPHTSRVGALSPRLKGHSPAQPSTPDPPASWKKECLTAPLMVAGAGEVFGGF